MVGLSLTFLTGTCFGYATIVGLISEEVDKAHCNVFMHLEQQQQQQLENNMKNERKQLIS